MGLAVPGSVVCLVIVVGFDVVVVVDLVLSVLGLGAVDGLVVVVGLIVGLEVVVELIVVVLVVVVGFVVVFVVRSDVGTGVGLFVVIGFPVRILGVVDTAQSTFTL